MAQCPIPAMCHIWSCTASVLACCAAPMPFATAVLICLSSGSVLFVGGVNSTRLNRFEVDF